jgi:hypothetical protein
LAITNAASPPSGRHTARSRFGRLFHNAEQRMPPLRSSVGGNFVGGLDAHDLLAQHPEFGIADPVELHAQIENSDRQQLGGISPAALAKRGPAFIEGLKNMKHLFV